jgi:hypothetical protein
MHVTNAFTTAYSGIVAIWVFLTSDEISFS